MSLLSQSGQKQKAELLLPRHHTYSEKINQHHGDRSFSFKILSELCQEVKESHFYVEFCHAGTLTEVLQNPSTGIVRSPVSCL